MTSGMQGPGTNREGGAEATRVDQLSLSRISVFWLGIFLVWLWKVENEQDAIVFLLHHDSGGVWIESTVSITLLSSELKLRLHRLHAATHRAGLPMC